MRLIDGVETGIEVLPRRWVRRGLTVLVVGMALTGWTAPVQWFIREKAASVQDEITPIVTQLFADLAVSPTPLATP
ncbi:hypothetical protein [Cellulomonas sp. HZM]|uniref:hypothetical protein n=1 Tax=Cellulomonas sp. HZM TaxID=1454010 RepID=UPI00049348C9|nr:hypothetical protein [Cellulomonas sp. HZM]